MKTFNHWTEALAFAIEQTYQGIPCVRVSSAQARGKAKQYPYWGIVNYEVRFSKRLGRPYLYALHRASSQRRSYKLACRDADERSKKLNKIKVDGQSGKIGANDAKEIVRFICEN